MDVVITVRSDRPADVVDDLERRIDEALLAGPRAVALDMSAVEQVSSTTIAALLWARRRCSARGAEILLLHPSRRCRNALERMGLLSMVAVVPSNLVDGIRHPMPVATTKAPPQIDAERRHEIASTTGTAPGVTRFDLLCYPEVAESVTALTRRWAEDRALSFAGRERLAVLARAATKHGLGFQPRAVTLLLRWADLDHARLELMWIGGASTSAASGDLESTISTLDAFADQWGLGQQGDGRMHWIIANIA